MAATASPTSDFVIIGAGSAGCVLAERLTASGRHSVTLIEAGGTDQRFWVQVPLGYGRTFFSPAVNWMYRTAPDPGLGGRQDFWPRGKVLGGSSSINAMVWMRGHRLDFDDWAAEGNPGWSFGEVLPLFKALEHNEAGEMPLRGQGGPMFVAHVAHAMHPLAGRFLRAGHQAGIPFNPDFNGPEQDGVGLYQITTLRGTRLSAARAFLRPALRRPNLRLIAEAHAMRLVFEGRRAVGVEILKGGKRQVVRAGRQVILAAGAVGSPQILQLSGVGPGQLLQQLDIDVVLDQPNVGANLQDHLGINYTWRARVPTLNDQLRRFFSRMATGAGYLLTRTGPLSLSLNQGGGFVRTRPGLDRPNIQLYFQAFSTVTARSGTRPILYPDPFPGFSIGLSTCTTESRGTIRITSRDPLKHPEIQPNSLSTARDRQDVVEGVKLLRVLAAQPAMAEVIDTELAPGPGVDSDEALLEDFRQRCGTVYHPSCTCRMGPDPATAVVDARLRVHGIEGLRVVDASIMPKVISGNTNAPTMMIAWKGAEMILEDCA